MGFRYVAGVDEAGRGPLAGPVVAAAEDMRPVANLRQQLLNAQQTLEQDYWNDIGTLEGLERGRRDFEILHQVSSAFDGEIDAFQSLSAGASDKTTYRIVVGGVPESSASSLASAASRHPMGPVRKRYRQIARLSARFTRVSPFASPRRNRTAPGTLLCTTSLQGEATSSTIPRTRYQYVPEGTAASTKRSSEPESFCTAS